ncbi:AraC family transcriptional regulator [Rhizobium sp. P32RR-XVIII]|uniref:helix-turn-helix domain-containing protein n=1 Tax=Rhizobium sp. P32RR-XVIII TaxID=2726738 RepID=UPI001FEDD5A2|nr:AraC family transcriptional regulator [Rhizobium sp. P32RR-XVIII]
MMPTSTAVLTNDVPLNFSQINTDTSNEVSRLVMHAITCVERDEAIAIDLIKKASNLLRPYGLVDADNERQRIAVGGLAPWQVNRLKRFIEENLSNSISLDDLAQLVKLSTSYFSAAFKVSFGTSPHNFILSRRVEHAKHKMAHTDAPLSEIALDCGLADQAHLSRIFRRATGMTPSAWRRYSRRPDMLMAAS